MSVRLIRMACGGDALVLNNGTVSGVHDNPTRYILRANGNVDHVTQAGTSTQYAWITPAASATQYEARWTAISGTPDTSPASAGTWFALGSVDREWNEVNAAGFESCSFTLDIGRLGTSTPIVSATITIETDGS